MKKIDKFGEKGMEIIGELFGIIYDLVSSILFLLSPVIVILNKAFPGFDGYKLLIYLIIIWICFAALLFKGLKDEGVKDEEQSIQFWIDQDLKGIIYKILTAYITVSTIIFQKSEGIIIESISLSILVILCELYIKYLTKLANKERKIENKRYKFFDKFFYKTFHKIYEFYEFYVLTKLSEKFYKKKEDYYLFITGFEVNTILFLFHPFLLLYFYLKKTEIILIGLAAVIIFIIVLHFFPLFKSKNKNEIINLSEAKELPETKFNGMTKEEEDKFLNKNEIINLSEAKELLKTKFNGMTKKEKKEFLKKVDSYINPPK